MKKFSECYVTEHRFITIDELKAYAKGGRYLNNEERIEMNKLFGHAGCSFMKDKDGYYCYTHRARSDSYKKLSDIPKSVVEWIESTG
jgi:hypothetical protein